MDKMFKNGPAELAPPLRVYHPKKPKQIRVMFDSGAQYDDSLNYELLITGTDLKNTLLGVLICFRKEAIAFTADIEQTSYCFMVREKDFLWFQENYLNKDGGDYHMRVHVFGNSPSPAVAIHGLDQSVQVSEFNIDPDVKLFMMPDFYVDDGLKLLPTVEATVNLLKKTQEVLSKSNLRLHKIGNRKDVMEAFPSRDHASNLKDLDLDAHMLPIQCSLRLNWNLQTDCFLFSIPIDTNPYTRWGVSSMINSLHHPLGFAAPVTVQGKAILRELTAEIGNWGADAITSRIGGLLDVMEGILDL